MKRLLLAFCILPLILDAQKYRGLQVNLLPGFLIAHREYMANMEAHSFGIVGSGGSHRFSPRLISYPWQLITVDRHARLGGFLFLAADHGNESKTRSQCVYRQRASCSWRVLR